MQYLFVQMPFAGAAAFWPRATEYLWDEGEEEEEEEGEDGEEGEGGEGEEEEKEGEVIEINRE